MSILRISTGRRAHTGGLVWHRNVDPLLGLHFRRVLGDAVCAERGLARRL